MGAALHWAAALVGRPWRADAAGPEAFDCKGLVRHVQAEHFGRDMPALLGAARLTDWAAVRESATLEGWRPVAGAPREGDVLLVRGGDGPHVGVFVRYGVLGVLHAAGTTARGGGVRFDEFDDLLGAGYGRPQIWRHHAE